MSDLLPAKFTDTEKREWHLAFNGGNILRLRDEVGVDIGNLRKGADFAELGVNHFKLMQVLWILCEKQADSKGVDEVSFAESFGNDTLEGATEAMQEAVVNFTPSTHRESVKKMIECSLGMMDQMTDVAMQAAIRDMTSGGKS